MATTVSLLRDITAFVKATKAPTSADKPVRLAVVDATYTTGWPKVTFEGEADLSGKQYPYIDSYSPAAGDRVVMVPVGTTYLIIGCVSSTGAGQPAGVIQEFAGSTAPAGWLLCDGTAVSRSTYARLFAAVGTTWGAGDGSTTFNVPDMRGRSPVGAGTGTGLTARTLAATGGAETVILGTGDLPAHDHGASSTHTHTFSDTASTDTATAHSHTLSGSTGSDAHTHSVGNQSLRSDISAAGGSTTATSGSGSTGSDSHSHTLSGSTGSGGSHSHSVTVSGTSGTSGAHTHTSVGSGTGHANMQPWTAVTFIIKT